MIRAGVRSTRGRSDRTNFLSESVLGGRDMRLTDLQGDVITGILA
jgi:hypothetical protein